MNAVRCPKCERELQEQNAAFESEGDDRFTVTCGFCKNQWLAHLADFYPLDEPKPLHQRPRPR
jgi:hypothetical protein